MPRLLGQTHQMLPLALTMGEPAGIGGEIALKAWAHRRADPVPPFFLIDDATRVMRLAQKAGLDVPVRVIEHPDQAISVFATALPVLDHPLPRPPEPGRPDPANGEAVRTAIERAVGLALDGQAAGLVTNPINKHVLYESGFAFPGHTEFLASLAGGSPIMMLACPVLRVVPVTIHMALRKAVDALTIDAIIAAGRGTAAGLAADFGIAKPRLAVAALNPHAGEGGAMGDEESAIIAPAIAALKAEGIAAFGPLPADTLFHERARAGYDAVLCMYHDQALVPLKTLDFDGGVNITLGLPFIRTSPDHGTAFDIAGTGRANQSSLVAALRMADDMAGHRNALRRKAGLSA